MPPSTWMQSRAQPTAASGAITAATPAAKPDSSAPSSEARAASQTTARAFSSSMSMRAHLCLTPWNCPIGRPNCSRTLAYADAVSTHHAARPAASAPSSSEARSRTSSPSSPVRIRPAGTTTSAASTRATLRVRSRLVERGHGERGGVGGDPLLAVVGAHRKHDHVGLAGAEHGLRGAADRQAAVGGAAGQPGGEGEGADRAAVGEATQELGACLGRLVGLEQGGAGQHGGEERAGYEVRGRGSPGPRRAPAARRPDRRTPRARAGPAAPARQGRSRSRAGSPQARRASRVRRSRVSGARPIPAPRQRVRHAPRSARWPC